EPSPAASDALPFSAVPTPISSLSAQKTQAPTDHLTLAGVGRLVSVAPKLARAAEQEPQADARAAEPAPQAAGAVPDAAPVPDSDSDSGSDESPVELLDAVVGSLLATTEPPAVVPALAESPPQASPVASDKDPLGTDAALAAEAAPPRAEEPASAPPSGEVASRSESASAPPSGEQTSSDPAAPADEFADALADALRALEQQQAARAPAALPAFPALEASSEAPPDEPEATAPNVDFDRPARDADVAPVAAAEAAQSNATATADPEPVQELGQPGDETLQSGETPRPATAKPRTENTGSVVRTALLSVAAAALSYGAVQLLVRPEAPAAQAPEQAAAPAAAPSASAANPANPAKPAQQGTLAVQSDTLDLPPGIVLAPGKGLLEIDTGDRGAIYVDDTFVGLGPMRRVPIEPGKHALRVRIDGTEHAHTAEVSAGRRQRVSLRPSGK
ncbi:MAG TPA: hypothetical protein VKZ49_06235, partial [Polyangiaceae bacterium]|nr:hypothetical protein [Polyangiaceae bacterium]